MDDNTDYHEREQYLYVPAREFDGDDRKKPTVKWVNGDLADDLSSDECRSAKNPYVKTWDETDPNEPHIIVGRIDGRMLDIDIDVGDDHEEIWDGDIDNIIIPNAALAFRSASGGLHIVVKFRNDVTGINGVEGIDIQGDTSSAKGVITSPFHHPEYEIIHEPPGIGCLDEIINGDDYIETINDGTGAELLVGDDRTVDTTDDANISEMLSAQKTPASSYDGEEHLDESDIRDALKCVDADCGYDEWRAIGYALDDFFDNHATACDVYRDWSRTGTKWDSDAPTKLAKIMHSARPAGAKDVTAGTLFARAEKEGGWEMPTKNGGSTSLRDRRNKLTDELEAASELSSVSERASTEEDLIADFCEDNAKDIKENSDIGKFAAIVSKASEFFNKTEVKNAANSAIESSVDAQRFDTVVEETLDYVKVIRTTDHIQDATYRWHFGDDVVETSGGSNTTTHFNWNTFKNEYYDATGDMPAKPSEGLREADDWQRFIVNVTKARGEETTNVGVRTKAHNQLKNYINNTQGVGTLEGAVRINGVYCEGGLDDCTEIWVPNSKPISICEDLEIDSTAKLQSELASRGYTIGGDSVSKTTSVNQQHMTFWVLSPDFAKPDSFVDNPDEFENGGPETYGDLEKKKNKLTTEPINDSDNL